MLDLEALIKQAGDTILKASDLKSLDDCRIYYLGKKGQLTEFLKNVGHLPVAERPLVGQQVNQAKQKIQALLDEQTKSLQQKQIAEQLAAETLDVTLPGRGQAFGSVHPLSQVRERIENIFASLGFILQEGPEIEDDYHNFEALNIPPLHPARAMQDTFYFSDGTLLRTQTSNIQIRVMEMAPPPFRSIAIGRVYRRESDLTHTPMFHQIEGFMVDKNVSFSDLKGILTEFLHAFFSRPVAVRFRPSYFPFTEPSAEVDIGCLNCQASGCRLCKNTGWLEILGCGMVHPNVLQRVNINPEDYTGWAFGCGLDRLTLLHYGVTDLRSLFENDLRFLRQF